MASETGQASSGEPHPLRAMICVDNSDNSLRAFDYYLEHIHRADNEVIVLHVSGQVRLPTYALFSEGVGFSAEEMNARVEELKKKNRELEDKFNTKCNAGHVKHKVLIISEDSDGQGAAIVESAKKHHVNLIIMGSRGHSTIRRTFLGSVSTYVIHHSHIPTLVCPPPKQQHH